MVLACLLVPGFSFPTATAACLGPCRVGSAATTPRDRSHNVRCWPGSGLSVRLLGLPRALRTVAARRAESLRDNPGESTECHGQISSSRVVTWTQRRPQVTRYWTRSARLNQEPGPCPDRVLLDVRRFIGTLEPYRARGFQGLGQSKESPGSYLMAVQLSCGAAGGVTVVEEGISS